MLKASLRAIAPLEVHVATDGAEGIRLLKAGRFDLIVCDWNMPNMSGLEVLQQVRGWDASRATPFIMLTAESSEDRVLVAIEAGATDYIIKPWTLETLGEKLRQHIELGPEQRSRS